MLQRSKRRNWKIIKVIKTVRLENLAVFLCVDIKRIYFCTIIRVQRRTGDDMAVQILIVEDDLLLGEAIQDYFKSKGWNTTVATDGEMALEFFESNQYQLILLDVMLPKQNGSSVCRKIREQSDVPIFFITARVMEEDELNGYAVGADDYITKPFNILEVKARIKAITRRTTKSAKQKKDDSIIKASDMTLDTDSKRLHIKDQEINLTSKEFDVLELLVKNPDKVYSREKLLSLVWGSQYPGDVRTVDVHIRRLREKIEANPSDPKYVHTKWGVGYYFKG